MSSIEQHQHRYWQVDSFTQTPYDVANQPMQGEMDSTFFLTKEKNFIPHTYPCRTAYIAQARGKAPIPSQQPDWVNARNILPMGSQKLDLSGFWFRATRIQAWARTAVYAEQAGTATLSLGICGAATLFVNQQEAGWLAPVIRNAVTDAQFSVELKQGMNELTVFMDDLAERDAVLTLSLNFISGPNTHPAMPYTVSDDLVKSIEQSLLDMHLNQSHYDDADIYLELPTPLAFDAQLSVNIAGHFMAHDQESIIKQIDKGQRQIKLCHSSELPADYRYFHLSLSAQGFICHATLGAEISVRSTCEKPAATVPARARQTIDWLASNAEKDTSRALACLARGTPSDLKIAQQIIAAALPSIEHCWDCADFTLVPMLWGRIVYADKISDQLRSEIDRTLLAYRYWMDEPGNDVQWYFSENHALLFHTSAYLAGNLLATETFNKSERTGKEQSAVGRQRLLEWFDHFETSEMAEFNSAPYFPIDLKGLTALFALAPDRDIQARAHQAINRLIEIVANSSHQGVITAAQGRSYQHSLCAADTLELTAIARMLWGVGAYGAHIGCLPQLALCLSQYDLTIEEFKDRACWQSDDAQEWAYCQGKAGFAKLYHYKTRDTALGSCASYRWSEWGYQETLIHGRIGDNPLAQFWINQPGEMIQAGYGRPSFWGGSASIPRVQQYRNLAIVKFSGVAPQPDVTHCWFPTASFDQWQLAKDRACAQSANGLLAIKTSSELTLIDKGASAHNELRCAGRSTLWVLRLGSGDNLSYFAKQHLLAAQETDNNTIKVEDVDYGCVLFHLDGRVEAQERTLEPSSWTMSGQRQILSLT